MALLAKPDLNLQQNPNPSPPKQLLHHHHGHHLSITHRRKTYPFLKSSPINPIFCSSSSSKPKTTHQPKPRGTTKWTALDIATAGTILSTHVLSTFAPWTFAWPALWTAIALYIVTGLFGITLSFHRNLAHKSFRLKKKWVEYLLAYFGAQALQGNPMDWVSTHRYHHLYCDGEKDPHSPVVDGFWFSHVGWLFDSSAVAEKCGEPENVGDLAKQPFYQFLKQTYIAHPISLTILLYAVGGFPFVVWGMGVRIVWVYHITWLVNSACHVWGYKSWNTDDLSTNNWWVAILAFGEGWHNNHHAFEYSARHGLEWWEFDMTWYVIKLLEALGLATDVRLPSQACKKKMSLTNG